MRRGYRVSNRIDNSGFYSYSNFALALTCAFLVSEHCGFWLNISAGQTITSTHAERANSSMLHVRQVSAAYPLRELIILWQLDGERLNAWQGRFGQRQGSDGSATSRRWRNFRQRLRTPRHGRERLGMAPTGIDSARPKFSRPGYKVALGKGPTQVERPLSVHRRYEAVAATGNPARRFCVPAHVRQNPPPPAFIHCYPIDTCQFHRHRCYSTLEPLDHPYPSSIRFEAAARLFIPGFPHCHGLFSPLNINACGIWSHALELAFGCCWPSIPQWTLIC